MVRCMPWSISEPPPYNTFLSPNKASENRGRPLSKRRSKFPPYTGRFLDDENELQNIAGQALRPAVLSARMKLLCQREGYDEALELLKKAPYGTQIPVVWNTLISGVMRAQKFDLAYSIYTEVRASARFFLSYINYHCSKMKRRGVKPDMGTYATMMTGYGYIDDWSEFSKQLENCHAVHEHFFENREGLTFEGRDRLLIPTSKYFSILSKAGLHDKMFDIFNQMDASGPWSANAHVYGAMLAAIPYRTHSKKVDGRERNASDAKLLWRQMKDAERRGVASIDEYVIGRVLSILSRGRPADQQLALEIAKEYTGFAAPGEETRPAKVELTSNLRLSVLQLLRKLGRSRLIMHYTKQLMAADGANVAFWARYVLGAFNDIAIAAPSDESEKSLELLKRMLLEAVRRGDKLLRPTMHDYETALMLCWRCEDWTSACEVFHLMTGYHAGEFAPRFQDSAADQEQESSSQKSVRAERSEGLNLTPTNLAMLNLLRTAVMSKDGNIMRQYWEMYSYFFGFKPPPSSGWNSFQIRSYVHSQYFAMTFARYITELIDGCLPLAERSKVAGMESMRRWAQRTIQDSSTYKLIIPYMERSSPDSPEEGSKLKQAVDFELQLRHNTPA